jgi:hypothetical protein
MQEKNTQIAETLARLERWGAERRWIGPDPYEGLNSPIGRLAHSTRARQAVIQAYKRFPVQPPWPLRARPVPNAKALALALSGYATLAGQQLPGAQEFLELLPRELGRLNVLDDGAAWGYPFDTQTRHLFYDRYTPNAIATCFVVGALCDVAEATGDDRSLELALAARPYLLSLRTHAPGHGPFFAYVAAGSELVHNANLQVCGTLARLQGFDADEGAEAAVREAAAPTLARQRNDGLWPYGEAPNLGWVDNFHTAYTLEGISHVHAAFGIGTEALTKGLSAWKTSFFEADGSARYYPNSRYPLEPHSFASAIDLLCTLSEDHPELGDLALANRVAEAAIRELWLEEADCFAYQRTTLRLNARQLMRWTNAPMFRALTRLCSR